MDTYHKIQTVYLRDPETNFKTLLDGQFAKPEFEYLKYLDWEWTEKIDGMNIRVMWDGEAVSFAGKSDNASIHPDLYKALLATFTYPKVLAQFGTNEEGKEPVRVCLYGEGYGAGIQKGGDYRPDKNFILFDVKVGEVWLSRENVADVATNLECRIVPRLMTGTLVDAVGFARTGYKSIEAGERCVAEGIIMRPVTELFNRRGERVITKIKFKDFARG
jgi:hypothetical protein